MANPFVKAWKYVMALFNSKIDEHADPKVQIQQAIEEAQRQHQALTQQAASVIGNQRQLEMRLNRQLADIEKLQVNVRQAVTLADQATAAGDAAKATEYNNAAEAFAAQLVTVRAERGRPQGIARPGAAAPPRRPRRPSSRTRWCCSRRSPSAPSCSASSSRPRCRSRSASRCGR